MPGIQDIYSVNVSNRYDLGAGSEPDEESDSAADYDPFDTLKTLEEQKKHALEEAKKKKLTQAIRAKNQKKPTRFQENKDANVPAKKEGVVPPKSTKPPRQNEGPRSNNARRPPRTDKQSYGEGDENRRPPRRRINNDQTQTQTPKNEGGTDQQVKGDQSFGRPSGDNAGTGSGTGQNRDRAQRYRGGRGGYRGTGGGNPGRSYGGSRTDGRDDRGKREFDRRSGSDRSSVKPSDKRDGAGPRNWGTPGNEIEEAADVTPANAPETVGTWSADAGENETKETPKKDDATEEEKAEDKQPTEEELEMTLDEWKAKQEAQSKPSFNVRKPGEGENVDQWKNMKVLKKIKPDTKVEQTIDEQNKKQTKPQVNTNFQFGESRGFGGRGRGRGERGGGRGRGRGGRYGGDRAPRSGQQSLPDVQNEQEFPTLG